MKLRLILGDQLNTNITSLKGIDKRADVVLMCEVRTEATYVKHHKKKIAFLFSAMRHFAIELEKAQFQVKYTRYDDPLNAGSLLGEVKRYCRQYDVDEVIITEPGEYRLKTEMTGWASELGCPVTIREDTRFLCSTADFNNWASGRKQLRMEFFYREMRKKYAVLMDGEKPVGGQWNYDADNRKPPTENLIVPETYKAEPDKISAHVIKLVEQHFPDHFGDVYPFHFAVTRDQALSALDQFIAKRLHKFGDFQDAMVQGEAWMYHSHISFYINCGLLNPLECIRAAENAFHHDQAPLNAIEGFIRQILGWREYVRGVYWLKMPSYKTENYLEATRKLPSFYWDAQTQMNCLRQCVSETKQNAYAHHIQRLMVLGNFALLTGIHPDEVNEWYMLVYADAYEWVELPNVTGMILFADGGELGSKPYAASGAYINKMSNYCKSCRYKVSKKNGPDACPFNYLYWNFLMENDDKLRDNPRLRLVYKNVDRMDEGKRQAVLDDSRRFFNAMEADEANP
ncbi:MAG: cryptochrome/photolyase family protein [Alphaproteobacteria bacterium]